MRSAVLLLALALSGCAGAEALRWKPPAPRECGILYCESRTGRIDRKRDCRCTGQRSIEGILR